MNINEQKVTVAVAQEILRAAGLKIESLVKIPGKILGKFSFKIDGKSFDFVVNFDSGEHRVSAANSGKIAAKFTDTKSDPIIAAKNALDAIVSQHGAARIAKVIGDSEVEAKLHASNTNWEDYSVYNTIRGNPAFVVQSRMYGGKKVFQETDGCKVYLGLSYNSDEKLHMKKLRVPCGITSANMSVGICRQNNSKRLDIGVR